MDAGESFETALRAGVAVYNAGEFHAAHDPWEAVWLELPDGDDERLLHGLVQHTAAVYHARRRNWSGATGLAGSAGEYLAGLPDDYRGVDVAAVRSYLARLAADPELAERRDPPPLRYRGRAETADEVPFAAAALAAEAVAEEYDQYDEAVVDRAIEYAREDLESESGRDGGDEDAGERRDREMGPETGTRTRFAALVADFAGEPEQRRLVYRRLADHVERRRQRDHDVDGLF
jgi:hypothetical protein